MPYQIAGIDVHKKMLAVVIADVAVDGEYQFVRRRVGTSPSQLRALADWLVEQQVEEVVMESTAQYWRPVWEALERDWQSIRQQREAAGADRGSAAPGPGAIESRRSRAEERFSGRRAFSEAFGGAGTGPEFCARRRTAPVADGHAPQVPSVAEPRAVAKPP